MAFSFYCEDWLRYNEADTRATRPTNSKMKTLSEIKQASVRKIAHIMLVYRTTDEELNELLLWQLDILKASEGELAKVVARKELSSLSLDGFCVIGSMRIVLLGFLKTEGYII